MPSTTYHVPIAPGSSISTTPVNAALSGLDAAIASEVASRIAADDLISVSGSGVTTTLDASAAAGQKVIPVTSTDGITVGESAFLLGADGDMEGIVVAAVSAGVSVTAVANLVHAYVIGDLLSLSPAEVALARNGYPSLGHRLDTESGGTPIAGEVLTGLGYGERGWLPLYRPHDHSDAIYGETLSPAGGFNLQSELTTVPLVGDTDDWDPNGGDLAFAWIMSTASGDHTVSGIMAPAVGGAVHWLYNIGAGLITLLHNDTSSAAANRIYCPTAIDAAVRGSDSVLIRYSPSMSRWLVLGHDVI